MNPDEVEEAVEFTRTVVVFVTLAVVELSYGTTPSVEMMYSGGTSNSS